MKQNVDGEICLFGNARRSAKENKYLVPEKFFARESLGIRISLLKGNLQVGDCHGPEISGTFDQSRI